MENNKMKHGKNKNKEDYYETKCYIFYLGEGYSFYKDRTFTARCTHVVGSDLVTSSMGYELSIDEDKDSDLGEQSDYFTSDPNSNLKICNKDEATQDCVEDANLVIGE